MTMHNRSQHTAPQRAEHAAVWRLLPWYVNHSLDPIERDTVERHLANCLLCQREVDTLRKIERGIRDTSLDDMIERSLAATHTKISQTQDRSLSTRWRSWLAAAAEHMREVPFGARAALTSQMVVIAFGAWFFLTFPTYTPPATYRTLSEAPATSAAPLLRLRFAEGITEQQLRTLLLRESLRIVDGPSVTGLYTLSASEPPPLNTLLDRLQAAPEIGFVAAVTP